jgi:hypothetical protein
VGVKEAGGTRVAGDMLPGRARPMPCHATGLMQMHGTVAMTGASLVAGARLVEARQPPSTWLAPRPRPAGPSLRRRIPRAPSPAEGKSHRHRMRARALPLPVAPPTPGRGPRQPAGQG